MSVSTYVYVFVLVLLLVLVYVHVHIYVYVYVAVSTHIYIYVYIHYVQIDKTRMITVCWKPHAKLPPRRSSLHNSDCFLFYYLVFGHMDPYRKHTELDRVPSFPDA